eukprot:CAMPEP_0172642508 /NCGR_PEP_ID=MMETSP1068-20121228/232524_1 /TAXON_ID=35684 /ORGANISM="Pseudopedinella elastica, Strain CCMP716" /LENGTH=103 /DNA_ID=CAMNT_0013456347 /DNA_START=137 /DNA_END=448 /DNA_ORIENTATION=+
MNAIAISKPQRGLVPDDEKVPRSPAPSVQGDEEEEFENARLDPTTDPLLSIRTSLAPGRPAAEGVCGELAERASGLLLAFRRCGVFIAIWNLLLMLAMVFVFA